MPASSETLRHYAMSALGLAAEMEVDGYDPDIVKIFEAAGGSLLVEAVKAERASQAKHPSVAWRWQDAGYSTVVAPNIISTDDLPHNVGPFLREPLPYDVARRRNPVGSFYIPAEPVANNVDAMTRWACCGATANTPEHFGFCPSFTPTGEPK